MEAGIPPCLPYCLLTCLGLTVDRKTSPSQCPLETAVAILDGDRVGEPLHGCHQQTLTSWGWYEYLQPPTQGGSLLLTQPIEPAGIADSEPLVDDSLMDLPPPGIARDEPFAACTELLDLLDEDSLKCLPFCSHGGELRRPPVYK